MLEKETSDYEVDFIEGIYELISNRDDATEKCMNECGKRCDKCRIRNCSAQSGHRGPHRCGIC